MQTTPVPNAVFDEYVRILSGTELKVFLIIIRQTLGWEDKRGKFGRKEMDWICGSQLQQKTGCSRRAITSAIDILIKRNLIQVLDEKGSVLDSAEKRQGKTRLYYRLSLTVYYPVENRMNITPTSAKFAQEMSKKVTALVQKMHITKETLQN
jgi:biotin operon repressor